MSITIYHNPKCSKSRATLALLIENKIEPDIIEYLDPEQLGQSRAGAAKLVLSVRAMMEQNLAGSVHRQM